MGKLNKNFKPQFGFLTREDVVIKVLSGGYGVKADKPCKQAESQHIQAEPQHVVPKKDVAEEVHEISTSKEITNHKLNSQDNHGPSQQETLQIMEREWNEVFKHSIRPIPFYSSKKNRHTLLHIWREHFDCDIEKWRSYAIAINGSEFLMGEKKKSFRANFSWLIKEETIERIKGGDYGVGDRELDMNRAEENRIKKVKEIGTVNKGFAK
ncbi:hypothetical protein Cyrtocomes_01089 [Candidatus Cyrtobacter comes]|uniref:Uncharacterized protein n=1 Tax=Candidatus Cyrtobacter comes TaxID=675776 RepID=A0ABU5L9H4_9RICK|nr:hypothetical protein [Candidatus Cyrtobacter comes]MDZ5762697.1 hypothetical protein [Candidatus Cyrtobacter comes]